MRLRLNKLLATRGVAARRKCDDLIQSGAVQVNGEVTTTPGARVDPDHDDVRVNGRRIPGAATLRYFVLNKPVGMISTLSDPQGRRSLREVMPAGARVFPVGRLDADTSGLLLLTNDGDLAHHLMHPRYGVEKFYRVVVDGRPALKQIEKLQRGVVFEPGVRSAPARVRERDAVARGSVIEIAIAEGRYRQVRRMCEAVGLDVVALHRWGYGPLRLGELARGMWRELSEEEVRLLRAASARPKALPASVRRPRGRRRGDPGRAAEPPRSYDTDRSDPFEVARRERPDRDVTGWPGEAPGGEEAGTRRPRARTRPRPMVEDEGRQRAERSREATRRFGPVPGGESRPRRGGRRDTTDALPPRGRRGAASDAPQQRGRKWGDSDPVPFQGRRRAAPGASPQRGRRRDASDAPPQRGRRGDAPDAGPFRGGRSADSGDSPRGGVSRRGPRREGEARGGAARRDAGARGGRPFRGASEASGRARDDRRSRGVGAGERPRRGASETSRRGGDDRRSRGVGAGERPRRGASGMPRRGRDDRRTRGVSPGERSRRGASEMPRPGRDDRRSRASGPGERSRRGASRTGRPAGGRKGSSRGGAPRGRSPRRRG